MAPEAEFAPEAKAKIKRQIAYYFSDSNLVKDEFMNRKIAEDADGFVDLSVLSTFNRMKPLLELDVGTKIGEAPRSKCAAVGQILRECDDLVVSEDGLRVKRKEPLGDVAEVKKLIRARTLHIHPFPFDEDMYRLEEFFRSKVPINSISMLKKRDCFNGEIFLECKTVEAAREFLKMEVTYAGAPLEKQFREEREAARRKRKEEKEEEAERIPEVEFTPGCIVRFEFIDGGPDAIFHKDIKNYLEKLGHPIKWVRYEKGCSIGMIQFESTDMANEFLSQVKVQSADEKAVVSDSTANTLEICGYAAKISKVEDTGEEKDFYSQRVLVLQRCSDHRKQKSREGAMADRAKGRGWRSKRGRGKGSGRGRAGNKRRAEDIPLEAGDETKRTQNGESVGIDQHKAPAQGEVTQSQQGEDMQVVPQTKRRKSDGVSGHGVEGNA